MQIEGAITAIGDGIRHTPNTAGRWGSQDGPVPADYASQFQLNGDERWWQLAPWGYRPDTAIDVPPIGSQVTIEIGVWNTRTLQVDPTDEDGNGRFVRSITVVG